MKLPHPILLPALMVLAILGSFCLAGDPPRTKPALFLIGDSTVKNGTSEVPGHGTMQAAGQAKTAVQRDNILKGWGAYLPDLFDQSKLEVSNDALGGTSSRSFLRAGLWTKVLAKVKPGDFVMIQFGHNDGGPIDSEKARASVKGNGNEAKEVIIKETGNTETVHSYGWYLRKYAADAKAKGATVIICSPIPRNIWKDSKVGRADADYGKWASEAATGAQAFFLPLNTLIANKYDALGPDRVMADYFTAEDHTHTIGGGAKANADCVVEGIRALKECPLAKYLR
jgi:rhamnogalacturonan acetylesterase